MQRCFKLRVCIIAIILSLLLSTTGYAIEEQGAIPRGQVNNALEDYDYRQKLSSTSDCDEWTMKPAKGLINFFMGDIPLGSVYSMKLYENGNLRAEIDNTGKTNALIKCRVNGTSTYTIKIKNKGSSLNTNDDYLFRYKTYESVSTVTGSLFSFQAAGFSSRQEMQKAQGSMWAMGYTATEYYNNSASAAYSVMDTSDVFAVHSVTSNEGSVLFYKNSYEATTMYANHSPLPSGDISLSNAPAGYMNDMELAIISGEFTARPTAVDLGEMTVEKGTFCSLTLEGGGGGIVYGEWLAWLFEALEGHISVKDALEIAANRIELKYGIDNYSMFHPDVVVQTATSAALVL